MFIVDHPMELGLSWPSGYYTLFMASNEGTNECPQETGFQWRTGSVKIPLRLLSSSTIGTTHLISVEVSPYVPAVSSGITFRFCSKTQEPGSNYFSLKWPAGKYCILRKSVNPGQGTCPESKFFNVIDKRI